MHGVNQHRSVNISVIFWQCAWYNFSVVHSRYSGKIQSSRPIFNWSFLSLLFRILPIYMYTVQVWLVWLKCPNAWTFSGNHQNFPDNNTTYITHPTLHTWCVYLTHWGRVTHICVSKLTIIGSDNGLSPGRRQAIIWTNAGILLIGPLRTNFSEILIEI